MFSLTLFLFGFAAANSPALSSDGKTTIMPDSTKSPAQALPATSLSQDNDVEDYYNIVNQFIEHHFGVISLKSSFNRTSVCQDKDFERNFNEVVRAADLDDNTFDEEAFCGSYIRFVAFLQNQAEHWGISEVWTKYESKVWLNKYFDQKYHTKVIEEMSNQLVVLEFFDYFNEDENPEILRQNFKQVMEAADIPPSNLDQILANESLSRFLNASERIRIIPVMERHLAKAEEDRINKAMYYLQIVGVVFVVGVIMMVLSFCCLRSTKEQEDPVQVNKQQDDQISQSDTTTTTSYSKSGKFVGSVGFILVLEALYWGVFVNLDLNSPKNQWCMAGLIANAILLIILPIFCCILACSLK
jgi:hypothetical protein